MNKMSIADPIPRQDEEYEMALDATLLEIESNRRDMTKSQARIERLRAETGTMLEETKQLLAKLAT